MSKQKLVKVLLSQRNGIYRILRVDYRIDKLTTIPIPITDIGPKLAWKFTSQGEYTKHSNLD